jgi:8-oxo-dGTP pyrophosphatase MutT (NUDIX family)
MYKIYINDKPIIFSHQHIQLNMPDTDVAILSESDDLFFNNDFLSALESKKGYIIHTSEEKNSFEKFVANLIVIEAAGGLVYNAEKDSILFIYRRNKWDLPKGKIDKGEGIQVAALREVEEECGIKSHKIKSFLTDTYHIFNMNNKWYLKKTYWFNMQCSTEEKLIPQAEEDITAIEWVNKNDLSKIKSNTYAMITDILNDL